MLACLNALDAWQGRLPFQLCVWAGVAARRFAWVLDPLLTRAFAPTIHTAGLLLLYLQEVLAQKAALEEGNKELQEKYNQKAM